MSADEQIGKVCISERRCRFRRLLYPIDVNGYFGGVLHGGDVKPCPGACGRRAYYGIWNPFTAAIVESSPAEAEPEALIGLLKQPPAIGVEIPSAYGHFIDDRHITCNSIEVNPGIHGEFALGNMS